MRCDVWWASPVTATPGLLALLDENDRERYANYRNEIDKLRFLTGRSMIRMVAGRRLGRAPESIVLDSSCFDCGKPHGKPRVLPDPADPTPVPELSVSHSGDWVVLAVTCGAPVGVDVEEVRDADVDGLANIAFSPTERGVFTGVPADVRRAAFFTYWSRKEAVLKATGKGMSIPMSKLTLTAHDQLPLVLASDTAEVDATAVHMVDLDAGDDYRAAVAAVSTEQPRDDWLVEHDANPLLAELG